jgi:hypothetical protein
MTSYAFLYVKVAASGWLFCRFVSCFSAFFFSFGSPCLAFRIPLCHFERKREISFLCLVTCFNVHEISHCANAPFEMTVCVWFEMTSLLRGKSLLMLVF